MEASKSFIETTTNMHRRKPIATFVGRIQDEDTLAGALELVQEGHNVYGTVHSNGKKNELNFRSSNF